MLSLRGVVRDEAISVFGQRLLRSAAQKQIFNPPSQALPGTAVVRRLRLIPSPGRAWGRACVPFLLESLASALWTTRNDALALCQAVEVLSHSPYIDNQKKR